MKKRLSPVQWIQLTTLAFFLVGFCASLNYVQHGSDRSIPPRQRSTLAKLELKSNDLLRKDQDLLYRIGVAQFTGHAQTATALYPSEQKINKKWEHVADEILKMKKRLPHSAWSYPIMHALLS